MADDNGAVAEPKRHSVYEEADDRRASKLERLEKILVRQKMDVKGALQEIAKRDRMIKKQAIELEEARAKYDSSAMGKRIKELEGMHRVRAHRDRFHEIAKGLGADPETLDYLFQLSDWKVTSDEVDVDAMTATVEEMKSKPGMAKLFAPPSNGEPAAPVKPPPKPAVGSGQGGSTVSFVDFTEEQKNDPEFVMRNYERMVDSARHKLARGEA